MRDRPRYLVVVAMAEERDAMAPFLAAASDLVVVECGVGKVQAALGTALAIRRWRPTAVLSVGVAGAVVPTLAIGDLVVGTDVVQHDVDVTALGLPPGEFPGVTTRIAADPRLVERLQDAAQSAGVAPPERGTVASGDVFLHDPRTRGRLRETFGATAVDMEAAAVGFVAQAEGLPFGVLKAVSDQADGRAAADFTAFLGAAARTLGEVLAALSRLP